MESISFMFQIKIVQTEQLLITVTFLSMQKMLYIHSVFQQEYCYPYFKNKTLFTQ